LMELMLRKFCFQNIMWWLEISESSRSNYCHNSKKSWKQTAGWKYHKALDGIDVAKILFSKHNVMAGNIRKLSLELRCRKSCYNCKKTIMWWQNHILSQTDTGRHGSPVIYSSIT
jgi:hypothetical protein